VTAQSIWVVIALLALIVLWQRLSFLLLPAQFRPRGALLRALSFAPVAALMAICIPEIFQGAMRAPDEPLAWVSDGRVLAAAVVFVAMRQGLNALWCLSLAAAVLWLF
jgi:branched-subunit amino acid transport protein